MNDLETARWFSSHPDIKDCDIKDRIRALEALAGGIHSRAR